MTATATAEPTTTAEPTKLFEQEVIVAGEYRLKLSRTATEETEKIIATVPPSWDFGDWRSEEDFTGPTAEEVEDACCKALGAKVEIDQIEGRAKDTEIVITFLCVLEEPEPADDESADDANFKRVVLEFEEECELAEARYLADKEKAKDSKEIFDGKVAEMRAFIKEYRSPKPLPLFDKKPGKNGHAKSSPEGEPRDNPDPIEVLKEFGLTDPIIEKLKKADITTIGGLVRFQEQKGLEGHSAPLTTIKGIKGATLEKLDNACAAYWSARGQTVQAAVESVAGFTQLPAEDEAQPVVPELAAEQTEANGQDHQPELSDEKPEPARKGKRKKANGEASQA